MASSRSTNTVSLLVALLTTLALAVVLSLSFASQAQAKEMNVKSVNIEATVLETGDVEVSETRTILFDGNYHALWWYLGTSSFDGIQVTGVTIANADGSNLVNLEEIPFETQWRTTGYATTPSYAVDNQVDYSGNVTSVDPYVFYDFADGTTHQVTIHYTILGGANMYNDVAEFYWQLVGTDTEVSISNLTVTVNMPVLEGATVSVGDNLRAWGHGPLTGSIAIAEDGTITMTVPYVSAGQYVELRTTFPTDWLTDFTGQSIDADMLSQILEQEQEWADQANQQRMQALLMVIGVIGASAAIFIVILVLWLKFGKEYKPEFSDEYFRDVPADIHPALVSIVWENGDIKSVAFTATLMSLAEQGVITLEKIVSPNWRGKEIVDYMLIRNPERAAQVTDPTDKRALQFVFEQIGMGSNEVRMSSFRAIAKSSPSVIRSSMNLWRSELSMRSNLAELFEKRGNTLKTIGNVLSVVNAILALTMLSRDEFILAGICLVFTIPSFILSSKMTRRTKMAVEIHARCKALRRWFKDFSNLKEAVPTDVKIWRKLLVFAVVLGVSREVSRQLEARMPELIEDPYFFPMWYWVHWDIHSGHSPIEDITTTFNSALSTATSKTSSGGGGGGGFSGGSGGGGGGGGFGGR